MKPIEHIKIEKEMKVSELVEEMGNAGFGAGNISKAGLIMRKMIEDKDCKVFLGVAGAMVPGGMKKIILDMLDNVDVFVTTGANLTHDLIESLGEHHYHGDDKIDDAKLHKENIDRIYNVFMKNNVYEKLEDFFDKNYSVLKECKTVKEFLWKLGELTPGEGILKKCYKKQIPLFCPAISDCGIGLMMWGRAVEGKGDTNIDVFADMKEIIDLAWQAKKSGVIYVNGGFPKNFIQQSLQFSKGANYGIQLTNARTEDGGSSGAPLKEGISWGKMKEEGEFVDVFCDSTISLPLIYGYVKNYLK